MGLTYIELEIANTSDLTNWERLDFLVDSGATYSVVPPAVLDRLGIKPIIEQEFRLANGEKITRKRGGAAFRYGDRIGVGDLIFGEEGDYTLLGALTLESLGFALDPLKRELRELPMMLGGTFL